MSLIQNVQKILTVANTMLVFSALLAIRTVFTADEQVSPGLLIVTPHSSQGSFSWDPYSSNSNAQDRSTDPLSTPTNSSSTASESSPVHSDQSPVTTSASPQSSLLGFRLHCPGPPPLPTNTLRAMEEYVQLLPFGMYILVHAWFHKSDFILIHQRLLRNIRDE